MLASTEKKNQKKSIVVISPRSNFADLLQDILGSERYIVTALNDGAHFWESLRALYPHLIIIELNTQHSGGMETLEKIAQEPCLNSIPVILLSPTREPKGIAENLWSAFLRTPFDFEELQAKIALVLNAKKKAQA